MSGLITHDVKIDFKQRVIEPPIQARKRIAEAYFYMQATYELENIKQTATNI